MYGQQLNPHQLELSGFFMSGQTPLYGNSLDISGIAFAYSKYVFKKFNFGGELGFGSINGSSRTGVFERFDDLGKNRNYFHYRLSIGYEPIQRERFSLGFQMGALGFSYNGVTSMVTSGPGEIGEDPVRLTFGRLSQGFFTVGPYAIFKLTDNLFLKPQFNRGLVFDRSDWFLNSFSVGLGYRF